MVKLHIREFRVILSSVPSDIRQSETIWNMLIEHHIEDLYKQNFGSPEKSLILCSFVIINYISGIDFSSEIPHYTSNT